MIWTAFILGLAGSMHCAGMCGPLALALPHPGRGMAGFVAGRLFYQVGRITASTSCWGASSGCSVVRWPWQVCSGGCRSGPVS